MQIVVNPFAKLNLPEEETEKLGYNHGLFREKETTDHYSWETL